MDDITFQIQEKVLMRRELRGKGETDQLQKQKEKLVLQGTFLHSHCQAILALLDKYY